LVQNIGYNKILLYIKIKMEIERLKSLLDINNRSTLFYTLLKKFESFSQLENVEYKQFKTSEGDLPCILCRNEDFSNVKYLKVYVGAQHNEYNGLFGTIRYFEQILEGKIPLDMLLKPSQDVIFFPLMNPYGFLNPSKQNKSGYYLKNGTNLNRYWRRAFAPDSPLSEEDAIGYSLPDHVHIVQDVLEKYWENSDIKIMLLDFHETSLLERFQKDLVMNLQEKSITYKFDHWLKEGILFNIIKLNDIPYYRKPLFYKCNSAADHSHINLSMKQLEIVNEKVQNFYTNNINKLSFYFCYSDKSKGYCKLLARRVYEELKDHLWKTYFPAISHHFHDHGCFVKMSDATTRKNVYTMELESEKHFFNIFQEIKRSQRDPSYFDNKLEKINIAEKLSLESIKEMLKIKIKSRN
jgi:hypothetical protein